MSGQTATPSPYITEAYPWVAYGMAMLTTGRLSGIGNEDHTYRIFMIAAIGSLLLLSLYGFIRQRSIIPRFAAEPWRIALFVAVLAVAIITNPSVNVQIMIVISTCIVVMLRIMRIHQQINNELIH